MRAPWLRSIGHPAILFGLAVILCASACLFLIVRFHRRAILARGEIVSVSPGRGKSVDRVFLRYVYQDATGRKWEAATYYSATHYSGLPTQAGQSIGVFYDPLDPGASEIEGAWQKCLYPAMFVLFGVCSIVVGCIDAQQKNA